MKEKKQNNRRKNVDPDILIYENALENELDEQLLSLPDERRKEGKRSEKAPKKPETKKSNAKKTTEKKAKKKKPTNKEFARITYLFVSLFLVLMGYMVYFNVFKSKEIINSPYNIRQDLLAKRVVRGSILDKDGNVLAKTEIGEDGSETRVYPYGDLYAHAVGYAVKGKAGLESTENFNLLTSNAFFLEKMMKELKGEKNRGDQIVTTLDTNIQEAAYDALGDNKGAVVVIEPGTGKILSIVSKPSYDPGLVAEDWESLNANEDGIFLNRATQGQYAPGSTFKIVTALEYMREHPDYENYSFECTSEFSHEGTTIHCVNNRVHGSEDLTSSFANSCNASFSNIGIGLQLSKYKKTAEDLLFNSGLPCPLPYSKSKFALSKKDPSSEIMMTAIGQGKTMVSPYHMALITSAIANGGKLMKPYIVEEITNYSGTSVKKYMPEKYTELMTSKEAAALAEAMKAVVASGTATALSGEEYTVAGKTGTAEYSVDKEKAHSWFVGYSNVDNPELVVSVVIEGADETGAKAVHVAKKIFNAHYYG